MSADNQMNVEEIRGKWHVWMQLGDKYYKPDGSFHRVFKNREEAIDYAEYVCNTDIVEYGIHMVRRG